jgi:heme/copper-type cytochrome/quinol oxidase subunit 2
MKGTVIVETQEEYDRWIAGIKPQYMNVMQQQAPKPAATTDTTKAISARLDVKPADKN